MAREDTLPVVRTVREDWADRSVPLPSYETAGAAGADVRANLPPEARATGLVLAPMERRIVPTGLCIAVPAGFEAQIRPRSGLALKHGISLANTPGTIDSDYRGPLGVLLINLGADPFVIAHGERIAQIVVVPVVQARFTPVDMLDETARGAGGFGFDRARLMALVLVIAAALWGLGHLMRVPVAARQAMIGLLFVAVVALHVLLREGHPLRQAIGGSAGEWLVLGGLVGLVWLYARGLGLLRAWVRPENRNSSAPVTGSFAEAELARYARHIALREIGGPGQKALKSARVLVIGAGGLGSPVLLYLAAAGVGTIGVIDDDAVEATNLQRQVIHSDARIGMPKVFSAEIAMKALNPFVTVRPYHRRLTEEIAADLFADYDLVIEGVDNTDTRYLVNRATVARGMPLISGALGQWEGQVSTFNPAAGGPCYRCIFPTAPAAHLAPSCAEAGVLGPLPGIIGTIMAGEAIKEITGAGTGLRGRMMIYDALHGESRVIALKPRAGCPVCGGGSAG